MRTPHGPNISVCLLRIFAKDLFILLSRRYTTVLPLRIAWNSLRDGTHILYKHVRRISVEKNRFLLLLLIYYFVFYTLVLYSRSDLPVQDACLHEGAYPAFQLKKISIIHIRCRVKNYHLYVTKWLLEICYHGRGRLYLSMPLKLRSLWPCKCRSPCCCETGEK